MTQEEIRNLAEEWISAWNAHDLDAIMSHYDEAVELTSPVAAQLLRIPCGKVSGKANVSAYFQRGLEAYPQLYFDLKDVLAGLNTLVLYYAKPKRHAYGRIHGTRREWKGEAGVCTLQRLAKDSQNES